MYNCNVGDAGVILITHTTIWMMIIKGTQVGRDGLANVSYLIFALRQTCISFSPYNIYRE